jgi:hypothetical protein
MRNIVARMVAGVERDVCEVAAEVFVCVPARTNLGENSTRPVGRREGLPTKGKLAHYCGVSDIRIRINTIDSGHCEPATGKLREESAICPSLQRRRKTAVPSVAPLLGMTWIEGADEDTSF